MMHMQIHCGEKPYSYRQRQTRFYGDLKRGQLQKIHNQEVGETMRLIILTARGIVCAMNPKSC